MGVTVKKEGGNLKIEFLNRTKQYFDWDNNWIEDDEVLVKYKVMHPEIPDKIPVVDL